MITSRSLKIRFRIISRAWIIVTHLEHFSIESFYLRNYKNFGNEIFSVHANEMTKLTLTNTCEEHAFAFSSSGDYLIKSDNSLRNNCTKRWTKCNCFFLAQSWFTDRSHSPLHLFTFHLFSTRSLPAGCVCFSSNREKSRCKNYKYEAWFQVRGTIVFLSIGAAQSKLSIFTEAGEYARMVHTVEWTRGYTTIKRSF